MQQKLIVLTDWIAAAWAGDTVAASFILKLIREHAGEINHGQQVLDLIAESGLSEEELNSVSFIFYIYRDDGAVEVQDYLVKEHCATPTHKFKFAGSGDWHYFETIAFEQSGINCAPDQLTADICAIMGRAAIAFHEEVLTETPHNFRYGGGFEVLTPEKKMVKIPYSCAYWGFKGDEIQLTGPVISYQYLDSGLLQIDRFTRDTLGWQHSPFLIGNFFCSAECAKPAPPVIASGPMIHYLIDHERQRDKMVFHIELGQKTLALKATDTGTEMFVDVESRGYNDIRDEVARLKAET